jgi:predicted Zn-dependent protease
VKTQRWDDVARYAGELLPADKSNPALLRMLAEAALKRNHEAEASDFLEQALAVQHNDRDLRFKLARLYTNSETPDRQARAFDLMNEFVTANPEDAEAYLLLAHLYRRKSDTENARSYFQRGFQKMPAQVPAGLSWAYNSYGIMLLEEKKYEEALTFQSKALELDPKDDHAQYNIALTYLKLKRKDDVNSSREKLSQMGSPLLSQLDEQIEQSHINVDPKKRK